MNRFLIYAAVIGGAAIALPLILADTVSGWVLGPVTLAMGGVAGVLLMRSSGREASRRERVVPRTAKGLLIVVDVGFLLTIAGALLGPVSLLVLGVAVQILGAFLLWATDDQR
jgi:hypothetical protein